MRSTRTLALALALVVLVGLVGAIFARGRSATASTAVPASLPGELTHGAPWEPNLGQLRARLAALHLPALPAEGTALHIHSHLDVFVHGRHVVVPAGVGIDLAGEFISPLHTHDTTGVIHVESPTVRAFTLGEFMGVWGVRLHDGCLGSYCGGGSSALRAYVDGHPFAGNPADIVLAEHEEIVLAYGTPAELPQPVPSSFAFAPGL
jgi:hypothetical protein